MLIINRSHTWQTKYVPANNYIYWLNSAYILIFLIETGKSMIIKPMAVTIAKTVTVMEQKKKDTSHCFSVQALPKDNKHWMILKLSVYKVIAN